MKVKEGPISKWKSGVKKKTLAGRSFYGSAAATATFSDERGVAERTITFSEPDAAANVVVVDVIDMGMGFSMNPIANFDVAIQILSYSDGVVTCKVTVRVESTNTGSTVNWDGRVRVRGMFFGP